MERVKVNGIELEYRADGSGEPVLLIDMLIADCFVPLLSEPAAKVEESPAPVFDFAAQGLRHGAVLPRWNCGRSSAKSFMSMEVKP